MTPMLVRLAFAGIRSRLLALQTISQFFWSLLTITSSRIPPSSLHTRL